MEDAFNINMSLLKAQIFDTFKFATEKLLSSIPESYWINPV